MARYHDENAEAADDVGRHDCHLGHPASRMHDHLDTVLVRVWPGRLRKDVFHTESRIVSVLEAARTQGTMERVRKPSVSRREADPTQHVSRIIGRERLAGARRALEEVTANSTTQPTSRPDSLDVRPKIKHTQGGSLNF
ncbi:predicted protein [Verticillium alfalfae VaMs.102]|uniref:Predicted protein n=1 Tax=Verticillium alfalfae (strain VaMs.102 / ATCC MYA-4576 / FGSC 10136) TaxID=526221 RepID=C9SN14_VERA1|nr:predicted protein [Verticillium alfalfae VaMs.102]EEY20179.1 predicted protein [Verticillium alfalfae VaMs.102]